MGKSEVWWKRNERAIKYEKAGEIEKAIKLLEQNVADTADTPHLMTDCASAGTDRKRQVPTNNNEYFSRR